MSAIRPLLRALAAACLLAAAAALAAPLARAIEIPELRSRVVDRAGILSPAQRDQLEQRLLDFERQHGHQVVVHTTPSLEGLAIEDYSIQIAEQWKIGNKGLDDGVIFTVAPNERRLRIEVGYGLEGTLTDADASRIVRDQVSEDFKRGDLAHGIQAGVDAILAAISGEPQPLAPAPSGHGQKSLPPVLFWILLGLMVVLSLRQRRYGYWDGYGRRSYYSGGFGGGGGGGFSGGGGRFGGGGASGSW